MIESAKKIGRKVVIISAMIAALAIYVAPGTAYAQRGGNGGWQGGGWHGGGGHHGGISPGAAVGIGLGAFALGSALGASAAYPSYGYSYPNYGYSYPYASGYSYPSYAYSYPYSNGGYAYSGRSSPYYGS